MLKDNLRTAILLLVLFGAAFVWKECAVRDAIAEQELLSRGRATADSARITDSLIQVSVYRDSVRAQQDRARQQQIAGARREITRLRKGLIPYAEIVSGPDSTQYIGQLQMRDSVIAQQDLIIQSQDSSLAELRQSNADLRVLNLRLRGEREQFRALATAWQKRAQPGFLKKLGKGIPYALAGAVVWEAFR